MDHPAGGSGVAARRISSAQTFLMKYLFPVIWIGGFGLGTLTLWVHIIPANAANPPPVAMKWQFLVAWVIGSSFILWACAGLKRVRIDDTRLYISNYQREIAVPFGNVVNVTENRWLNIHPVTIEFRSPTDFGQRITFMPTILLFGFFRSHPVVAELRKLAGLP